MNRKEIITEFKQRYLRNEPVTEREVVASDPQFFRAVLEEFGSWYKLEREIGFLQRHLKERDKYFLYLMMKERKERFGIESLRPKNIEEEIKQKISDGFFTIKKLTKDVLVGWSQERVVFEAHTYFITGGTPQNFKKDRSILYENMNKYFADPTDFYKEYERRFLINPFIESPIQENLETVEVEETTNQTSVSFGIDIDTLLAAGVITEEVADQIREASLISVEKILEFVDTLEYGITDQQLAIENPQMFYAVRGRFGSLNSARNSSKEERKRA